eukprot:XP_011667119.1 PREDICTED: scavenger receptor class F member 1-like [Strongylocentrotus purpuratus]
MCPVGTYGVECVQRCTCGVGATCDPYSGLCSCQPNLNCMICREGFYGPTCKLTCPCDLGVSCDSFTGHCQQGPQANAGSFWTDFSISEMAAIALGAALIVVMVIGGALLIRSCCKHRSSQMLTLTRLPSDEPCRYTVDSDHVPAATAVTATKRHSAVFLTSDGDASIYWNQRASHFERQLPTIPGEGRLLRPASAQPLMRKHYERRSLRTERAPRCVSVACGEKLEYHRETTPDKTKLPVRPPNVGRLSGSEGNLCLPMRQENYGCTASASIPDYSRHSRVAKRNGNYDHLTRPVSWVSRCSRDSSPEPSPDGYHRLETPPTLRVKRGDTNKDRPGSSSNDLDFHSLHEYDHAPKLPPMKRGHLEKTDSAPLTENNYEEPLKVLRESKRESLERDDDGRKRTREIESEFRRKDSETSGENMYEVLTAP